MALWHVFSVPGREGSESPAAAVPTEPARVIRAEYPLSLIPGGIASDAEFETARASDPVLAEHYSDVGFLYPARFPRDRLLYASFRQNHSVVWTNSRILVHAGELVFADRYGSMVRGRCGNRLSEMPRTPVAFVDPPEVASDTPEIAFAPPPLPEDAASAYNFAPLDPFASLEPPAAVQPPPAGAGTRVVTTALPTEWPADSPFDATAIFGVFGPPGLGPVRRPLAPRAPVPEPGTSVLSLGAAGLLIAGAVALRRRALR